MTKINVSDLKAKGWAEQLKDAAAPSSPQEGKSTGHKYIVLAKEGKDQFFQTVEKAALSENVKKYSVSSITDISKQVLGHLKSQASREDLTSDKVHEYKQQASDIETYTRALIEAREAKRNQPVKRFFRGVALVMSAVASLAIVGIPFFILMRRADNRFKEEITKLKTEISESKETFMTDLLKIEADQKKQKAVRELLVKGNFSKDEINKLFELQDEIPEMLDRLHEFSKIDRKTADAETILKLLYSDIRRSFIRIMKEKNHLTVQTQIDRIPEILKFIDESVSSKDRLELLQKRLVEDYPQDVNNSLVVQFDKDMERGDTFLRTDAYHQVSDSSPLPSADIPKLEKTAAGLALLKELVKNEEDNRWLIPLQLVANQTTINNLFDGPIGVFNVEAAAKQWKDPETGQSFVLKADFAKDHPPIDLEIIRDPDTHQIREVKVRIIGALDIVAVDTSTNAIERVVEEGAIQGVLEYTLVLDDQNLPIVKDLKSNLVTSPARAARKLVEQNKAVIAEQMGQIPTLLKDSLQTISDAQFLAETQATFDQAFNAKKGVPYPAFEKDVARGDSFKRTDRLSQIIDAESQPASSIPKEEKVKKAIEILQELIQSEEDQQWMIALQKAVNQIPLIGTFGAFMALFNLNSVAKSWVDPIDQKEYYLMADFPHKVDIRGKKLSSHPPINLEIIRDSETRQITEVKVTIQGTLDINLVEKEGESHAFSPDAIHADIEFSVAMEGNRFVVKDLKRTFSAFTLPL